MTPPLPQPLGPERTPPIVYQLTPGVGRGAGDGESLPAVAPFDIREVLRVLRARMLLIFGVTAAAAALGVYWIKSTVPVFESRATIRLKDTRREMAGALVEGPMEGLAGRQVDPLLSEIEILTSRAVAVSVTDSTPYLRVRTQGIPARSLADLNIDSLAEPDSVELRFERSEIRASGGGRTIRVGYGDRLSMGGLSFQIAQRPAADHAVVRLIPRQSAVNQLMSGLKVKPRQNTDVVDVSFTHSDPYLARSVTNRIIQTFQEVNASAAQEVSVRRRRFLEAQLHRQDSLLNDARSALSQFRGRQRAYSTKVRLTTEQAGLTGLQAQRNDLDATRRLYRSLLGKLQESGNNPGDDQVGAIMSSVGTAGNPVVADLYSALVRYQAARDSLVTGDWGSSVTNPDVQRLDTLIQGTKKRLVGGVESAINALDARIASLDDLRARNATAFPELSSTEEEEARLEERFTTAREVEAQLQAEFEKARLAEAVSVGQVAIVDLAGAASGPIGIGPFRKMAFCLAFGFGIGLVLALVLEHLDTSIRGRAQLRSRLGVPELAVIPPILSRRRSQLARRHDRGAHRTPVLRPGENGRTSNIGRLADGLVVASNVHSIAAEAYRLLRTNLLFSLPEGPLRTVLVTSPAPGDGKTTVAANLAIAFAQQGMRVLLVDADLRRGRIHHLFHTPHEPGLSQVLLGEIALDAAVRATPVTGLSVLTTGRIPDAPNELVGTDAMRNLLKVATREYAMVVVDSPPVLAASDASVIATISDATIVVVRAGRTHEEDALVTLSQLTAVGGNVVGAVLNDPDSAAKVSAGYYGYSGYYGKRE